MNFSMKAMDCESRRAVTATAPFSVGIPAGWNYEAMMREACPKWKILFWSQW
jgi:hypothetical protein